MHCYVYKGARKEDHYLYLDCAAENLEDDALPEALLTLLGDLSLVVAFELDKSRALAQADAVDVMANIKENGFYLQLPKKDPLEIEDEWFN